MKNFSVFLILTLLLSCSPIYVNYDYEKGTDFSQYKTYNYFADMQTGLSQFDTKRFMDALDVEMRSKGFKLSENPDFYVDVKSDEFRLAQRNTVGVGVGGSGGNVGGGISIGLPIGKSNIERRIIVDFVDENGIGLFWQAITEASFNPNAKPEKRESQMQAIVEKVLSKYPPQK